MATQVQQVQNRPLNGGHKYATLEEAEEGHRQKAREYYHNVIKTNKERYNKYQREYYQKKKEKEEQQYLLQYKYIQSGYIERIYLTETTIEGYANLRNKHLQILEEAENVILKIKEAPQEVLFVRLIILANLFLYCVYPTEENLLQWLVYKN
jgi:hypothetical protein